MKYNVFHVELKGYEHRLWRDIAISGNPTLMELAVVIGCSFQVEFNEPFYITDNSNTYASCLNEEVKNIKDARLLDTAHLKDLESSFLFLYDNHDYWLFSCTKKKEKLEKSNYPFAFVTDGYGQGLFECNKESFDAYMKGIIKPSDNDDSFLEDYEHDYELPFNMDFKCFGDFEKPLDLNNMKYSKQEIKLTIQYMEESKNLFDIDDDYENNDPFDFLNMDEPTEKNLGQALHMTRALIAFDIFEDDAINKEYRRLTKKYDMKEVFDMITEATLTVMLDSDDPQGDEFFRQRLRAIQKLK